jgi:hypothetical protein
VTTTQTPAQKAGFIVNVTRLKLSGGSDYYPEEKQAMVWLLSLDDGSGCPYFKSECGIESRYCAYVTDFTIIEDAPTVIGRFTPKGNNPHNSPFDVVSCEPNSVNPMGSYKGFKVSGEEYHVYSDYWNWEPVTEATAEAGPLESGYTKLQTFAINTFQAMYDDAVLHREGKAHRLCGDYGICDNIPRFAEFAGADTGKMIEVKENLIRQTASYSGDYNYPVKPVNDESASNSFSRHGNKWKGEYGLNRLTQLGELIEMLKTHWDDSLVVRQTPATRNGLEVGSLVRYTGDNSFWVFRRDDESMSPSFHRLGDCNDYTDLRLEYIKKVDASQIEERSVSEFLEVLTVKIEEQTSIEKQIAELKAKLVSVQSDVSLLDYSLAKQHKVKRI